MGKNKLILKRSSINIPYGFIIRHLSFYPSKDYEIEAIKRGEKPFYALAILGVKPSSAADEAGLQAGHRIIEINGQDVNTLSYSDVCKITERLVYCFLLGSSITLSTSMPLIQCLKRRKKAFEMISKAIS
ncbi:Regulator of sigma-E protease RseP [Dirofilaria immitis]